MNRYDRSPISHPGWLMKSYGKWLIVLALVWSGGVAFAADAKPAPTTSASATQPAVTPEAQLQFQQKNAQAQMQELEERMFRLGELLRQTEEGDAAKLIMAFHRAARAADPRRHEGHHRFARRAERPGPCIG